MSIPGGEELARKTLNSRIGIVGGLSILGTTGVVRPMSTASWRASVVQSIDVAAANSLRHIVLTTGGRSERFAEAVYPDLPEMAFVQMGIFTGDALKRAAERGVPTVTICGMIGKMAKLATGQMQTHVAGGGRRCRVPRRPGPRRRGTGRPRRGDRGGEHGPARRGADRRGGLHAVLRACRARCGPIVRGARRRSIEGRGDPVRLRRASAGAGLRRAGATRHWVMAGCTRPTGMVSHRLRESRWRPVRVGGPPGSDRPGTPSRTPTMDEGTYLASGAVRTIAASRGTDATPRSQARIPARFTPRLGPRPCAPMSRIVRRDGADRRGGQAADQAEQRTGCLRETPEDDQGPGRDRPEHRPGPSRDASARPMRIAARSRTATSRPARAGPAPG